MPRRFAIGSAQDLVQAERDIRARIGDSELDFAAMAAVSNIYRAANAIRNHMEQQVLAEEDLSWAAFTVLFVLWIWGDQQTRHLAAEAGVTKGTLTGVLKTLEKRGLARRRHYVGGWIEPNGTARVVDAKTYASAARLASKAPFSFASSPSGTIFVGGGYMRRLSTAREPVRCWRNCRPCTATWKSIPNAAVSPYGSLAAIQEVVGAVIWDLQKREPKAILAQERRPSFSPDGRLGRLAPRQPGCGSRCGTRQRAQSWR